MGPLIAIARNSFLETARQPVYALALVISTSLIALLPATALHLYTFTYGTDLERIPERMVADLGLATSQLAGLIVAIFTTTSIIATELDRKTAATVLSKPVGRLTFILGKYLGVAAGLALLTAAGVATTLLTIRIGSPLSSIDPIDPLVVGGLLLTAVLAAAIATARNYLQARPWVATFNASLLIGLALLFALFAVLDRDHHFIYAPGYTPPQRQALSYDQAAAILTYDWEVAAAGLMTIESVLVLAAVAVCASTRFGAVGNAAFTGAILILGLLNGVLQGLLREAGAGWAALPLRWLIPDLERFWLSDALIREVPIPGAYLALTSAYAGSVILMYLAFAGLLFDQRDVA